MADPIIPPLDVEAEIAAAQSALARGISSYTIGSRTISYDRRGMWDWLNYLLRLRDASAPGGARNYASFSRGRGRCREDSL